MTEMALKESYDIIVVGLGHAGCEAALASSRLGAAVLGLTLNMSSVARMSCNPSIGGPGKSQLVREIDALGGEMGLAADECFIHSRMLNCAKGPAVRAIRLQIDKAAYTARMTSALMSQQNLDIAEAQLESFIIEGGRIAGAIVGGRRIRAKAIVIASGTYPGGRTYIGEEVRDEGPEGFPASRLTDALVKAGIRIMRFKTGTSPRVAKDTVDYEDVEVQPGEALPYGFSNVRKPTPRAQEDCWITYTNLSTHEIIGENLDRAPIFSGLIKGIGPRYCPSIEAKVVRFAERQRHQLFIEPITIGGDEVYIAGLATSMPKDVQERMLKTIPGLKEARIMKFGYAIEYDCIDPLQLDHRLEFRSLPGLFSAGQSNGSSGYEEAAAQGLIAGANAALTASGKEPLTVGRDEGYIGVLIDDLVMKGTDEPYRMLTARAEYRLSLRQDNADFRLSPKAIRAGLADKDRKSAFEIKFKAKAKAAAGLKEPDMTMKGDFNVSRAANDTTRWLEWCAMESAALDGAYGGYIQKERRMAEAFRRMEGMSIPQDADYASMHRLSREARERLAEKRPSSIGEASRIPGLSPADIAALLIHLRQEA